MDKYVRVDWPESQEWFGTHREVISADVQGVGLVVFVPEELYNRVNNE